MARGTSVNALRDYPLDSLRSLNSVPPAVLIPLLPQFGDAVEECKEIAELRSKASVGDIRPLILVADDEPLVRSTIVEILRSEGYDAVGAKDGVEAVACAHKIQPDIFLADVAMQKMNGIEAAKQIKRLSPKTRIICFSGHAATSELLAKAKEQGHDFECLAKPIKPEVLIRTIQDMAI